MATVFAIFDQRPPLRLKKAPPALESWIDDHSEAAFAIVTAVYLVCVATMSHLKLLWFDELITLHIAQLGSLGAIWRALAQAADPTTSRRTSLRG